MGAKFIRFVTCGAQNRLHHVVRQKLIKRRPVAEAFVSPLLIGVGESSVAAVRLLLVEDDDEVAEATVELLRDIGFQAVRVCDGKAALAALDCDPTIEAVMSDIVMPGGMSGLELARTLREHRPELPLVMATGYSQYAQQVVKEGFALVEKPYRRDVLAASLRAAVERGRQVERIADPAEPYLDPAP